MVDLRLQYLMKWYTSWFMFAFQNRHRAKPNLQAWLSCERLLLPLMFYYIQMCRRNTLKAQTFGRAEVHMWQDWSERSVFNITERVFPQVSLGKDRAHFPQDSSTHFLFLIKIYSLGKCCLIKQQEKGVCCLQKYKEISFKDSPVLKRLVFKLDLPRQVWHV